MMNEKITDEIIDLIDDAKKWAEGGNWGKVREDILAIATILQNANDGKG